MKVQSLSHVRLFATPWTVAHQAPQSMGFSRQEYWSGVPFPSVEDKSSIAQNPEQCDASSVRFVTLPPGAKTAKGHQHLRSPFPDIIPVLSKQASFHFILLSFSSPSCSVFHEHFLKAQRRKEKGEK